MTIETFKKESGLNRTFNAFWGLTENLYNGFFHERFDPGREEKEKAMIADFLAQYDSLLAYNLATALKNQMDRDRRTILTKMMYEKDRVSPYIFQALSGLWDLLKEEINGDADHNRTEAYYDEVEKKVGEYARNQFCKDFARDLALSFINEIEDRDRAEKSEKNEEKSA